MTNSNNDNKSIVNGQYKNIIDAISSGTNIELEVDKQTLLNNLNVFMINQAVSQLPMIVKLYNLQVKCLDKYFEQVDELFENDDINIFLLEKIINTINNSIEKANNIILRLGLNQDITDNLIIKTIDNSQHLSIYQSQISKNKVIEAINQLITNNNDEEI